jgi:hypothetical protein
LDGTVHVGHKGKVAMTAVPSGRRRYVFRDGREAHEDSMRDMERAKLAMFRESEQAAMGGARPE